MFYLTLYPQDLPQWLTQNKASVHIFQVHKRMDSRKAAHLPYAREYLLVPCFPCVRCWLRAGALQSQTLGLNLHPALWTGSMVMVQ